MPPIVLASTSAGRRALLERLGVRFACESPAVDEHAAAAGLREPSAIARTLAKAKALAVARRQPDAIVIGGDQVCALDDRILGKPGTRDAARAQLQALRGREHRLLTAVAIVHRGQIHRILDETTLRMRDLTDAAIDRYLAHDEPFDCAGAYRIEGRGITLFESIHSHDHTAIVGLPLLAVTAALAGLGVELP